MSEDGLAEQALAFAWATHLDFPAAGQVLEAWASQKICEPGAALIELSEVLGPSGEGQRRALLRLAGDIRRGNAVEPLLDILAYGLTLEGESYDLGQVVRNLERFTRLAAQETALPLLPVDGAHAHALFRYYGLRDASETAAESIRRSEAYSATMELFQGLEPGSFRR